MSLASAVQCDDKHQNLVEVRPVKKRSDNVERNKRKEEWVRNEGPIKCELRLRARGGVVRVLLFSGLFF